MSATAADLHSYRVVGFWQSTNGKKSRSAMGQSGLRTQDKSLGRSSTGTWKYGGYRGNTARIHRVSTGNGPRCRSRISQDACLIAGSAIPPMAAGPRGPDLITACEAQVRSYDLWNTRATPDTFVIASRTDELLPQEPKGTTLDGVDLASPRTLYEVMPSESAKFATTCRERLFMCHHDSQIFPS